MHDLSKTVVAVATPPGRGGVGCVRISGPEAFTIAQGLFRAASQGDRDRIGYARFGRILGRDERPIDHGFLVLFAGGASFTGEPTAELWPHGSPVVLGELIETAIRAGALPAEPGEFTYRALRSGRLDLARAEAVRDLVEARTLFQARVAFAQTEGALSRRLAPLRESLEEWIARGEAAVEFVDESETHLPAGELRRAIDGLRRSCEDLLAGFATGRIVRDGATLALVGLPNVGKSSLFNCLLARARAIVTEVPGTTRDTLEESTDLDGIPLRLVDTAGLRFVEDPVEREGVRRAERARGEADLLLFVLDGARDLEPREIDELERALTPAASARTVLAINKSDLPGAADRAAAIPGAVRVSALTGEGIEELRRVLRERLIGAGPVEDPILTDARHARALEETARALDRARQSAADGIPEDLVLEDLREAMRHLGTIGGEFGIEDLYERIFSTFCIGK